MIQITKTPEPPILVQNKQTWTSELLQALKTYKKFSMLPEKYSKRYKETEIKEKLVESSHNKCVYCETFPGESGDIEVEHFLPKSKYPKYVYDWNNLFLACHLCNRNKGEHDSKKEPLVHPCLDNPESYFIYNYSSIRENPNAPDIKKAFRTLKKLDLDRYELRLARVKILRELENLCIELDKKLDDLELEKNKEKYRIRALAIEYTVAELKDWIDGKQKFAGFCRSIVNSHKILQRAEIILRTR